MGAKKNQFGDVMARLAPIAEHLPTQRSPAQLAVVQAEAKPAAVPRRAAAPIPAPVEEMAQISIDCRRSLRKEVERLAREADMTTKAFILDALRAKGVPVTDDDLIDRRKRR